jgi:hypothetical protein
LITRQSFEEIFANYLQQLPQPTATTELAAAAISQAS